jgi:hypothetical protein
MHTLTNESMARNLTIFAYGGAFLYLNKGSNFGSITYGAAVEVNEVVDLDVVSQRYVYNALSLVIYGCFLHLTN